MCSYLLRNSESHAESSANAYFFAQFLTNFLLITQSHIIRYSMVKIIQNRKRVVSTVISIQWDTIIAKTSNTIKKGFCLGASILLFIYLWLYWVFVAAQAFL